MDASAARISADLPSIASSIRIGALGRMDRLSRFGGSISCCCLASATRTCNLKRFYAGHGLSHCNYCSHVAKFDRCLRSDPASPGCPLAAHAPVANSSGEHCLSSPHLDRAGGGSLGMDLESWTAPTPLDRSVRDTHIRGASASLPNGILGSFCDHCIAVLRRFPPDTERVHQGRADTLTSATVTSNGAHSALAESAVPSAPGQHRHHGLDAFQGPAGAS